MRCVHFIGFRDGDQYRRACAIWGKPDFVHRDWDLRAKFGGERDSDDVLVFARGTDADDPKPWSFNDSAVNEDDPQIAIDLARVVAELRAEYGRGNSC